MEPVNCTVRAMATEEVPLAVDVWRETTMHVGTHSIYTWLAVDPEAIQVAVTNEGEVIGVCCACIHHEDLVKVGFYAVREKYRGLGVGLKVWNACMRHIGNRNACINAATGKLELYRDRGGFPVVESEWLCLVNETPHAIHPENLSEDLSSDIRIESFDDSLLPIIFEYDLKLIGYSRKLPLELNCKEQDSRTLIALEGNVCVGFGTIKMSCQGAGQVGPLYADDKSVAEVILKKLILSLPKAKGFVMMTLSNNAPANEFLTKIKCPTVDKCTRLYRKEKVNVDLNKVFAHFDLIFSPY